MTTSILDGLGQDQIDSGNLVKDTTTKDFSNDVIDASKDVPVLVDFWAPWCGPCKQLGPLLEKLVKKAGGSICLVKMNIDEHPEVAAQLGVKSIPAVFAFKDGRPVDGFMGALPESQVKSFIERIAGEGATETFRDVLDTAQSAYDEGDFETAIEVFAAVLGEDPENLDAISGLAKSYVKTNDLVRAQEVLDQAPDGKETATEIVSVRAMIDLSLKCDEAGDTASLESALVTDSNNHKARFDLALALNAQGLKSQALENLLEIVRRDPNWNEEAARKQLIQFFDAWGPTDESTVEGRRLLSSVMFS